MKKYLTAVALAALAQPAAATTFPTLTTIYVGAGVINTNHVATDQGLATSFHCTNVSGLTATVRYLVLHSVGTVAGSITREVPHGATTTASTHGTFLFVDDTNAIIPGTIVFQGGVNIESTQSGVFCTAMILDAAAGVPNGIDLHLVRVNPHPGTVE